MLDALALFVTIVEAGSLSAAAERLDMPAATVTRRLQALERELGCRLLHRSARRLQPTAEGLQYYEQCRPLIHALGQATRSLDDNLRRIAGHIRVLAPVNLASGPLTPAWLGFLRRHPEVSLEFQLSNTIQDLVGSGADLAIRVGDQADSLLTHRRLGQIGVRLVAAPAYLARRGTPATARDLAAHDAVVSMPLQEWSLRDPATGIESTVRPAARLRANEMRLALAAAEAGLGILLCPATFTLDGIARGTLSSLLEDWLPRPRPLFAVWPQQRYLPARVRALLDYLQAFIETEPIFGSVSGPARTA
ncbi:LysR family transcriptional regulator [Castellaniella denitrificans]|uniref:LysR family transcriptional regulator n=1 Tax=Castellaniella denitrificans TaxID=56119 RepID=A0ABT4M3W2_9BURK|nr:LysR family transcriptional regulator [Castellaniella denitrificans]MCZ4330004.1 LysR family transcriptional regulator [Castellaniella denitrificans]